jgi:MHS family proline/betaine transporter-like MFS transporter
MSAAALTRAAPAAGAVFAHEAVKPATRRAVVATAIGNGMEVYDFTVFSFFAATIGRVFFPSSSPLASLLLAFATFGVGFVMRPLGALLIGRYADRRGRKPALTLTIALMTVGTALIAFTPGHASIGVAGAVLVVIGRLLQGLSAGGEVGAASALLLESAAPNRRCWLVSWQLATQGGAALTGALVGAAVSGLLGADAMASWGWRVPFVLGLLIAPVGMFLRRHVSETHLPVTDDIVSDNGTLGAMLRARGRTIVLGMLLMTGGTATMYVMVFYLPTYLVTTLHLPQVMSYLVACMAGLGLLVMTPLFGLVADRVGHRKPMVAVSLAGLLVVMYPGFLLLSARPSLGAALAFVGLVVTLMAVGGAAGAALMMEAFPRRQRATGMSVMYSLGVTVFGGFAPMAVTWLIGATGNPAAPAWYVCAALAVSLVALMRFPAAGTRD